MNCARTTVCQTRWQSCWVYTHSFWHSWIAVAKFMHLCFSVFDIFGWNSMSCTTKFWIEQPCCPKLQQIHRQNHYHSQSLHIYLNSHQTYHCYTHAWQTISHWEDQCKDEDDAGTTKLIGGKNDTIGVSTKLTLIGRCMHSCLWPAKDLMQLVYVNF